MWGGFVGVVDELCEDASDDEFDDDEDVEDVDVDVGTGAGAGAYGGKGLYTFV